MLKKEAKRYWLMKTEPEVFSIADLQKTGTTWWEGVRNYQARNYMMNEMTVGDQAFFYHSNSEATGIAGICCISKAAQADPTQFDPQSEYYDPKATIEKPRWFCVQVKFVEAFPKIILLSDLRADPRLKEMLLLRPGQRLSIQPVTSTEFLYLDQLSKESSKGSGTISRREFDRGLEK